MNTCSAGNLFSLSNSAAIGFSSFSAKHLVVFCINKCSSFKLYKLLHLLGFTENNVINFMCLLQKFLRNKQNT